VARRIAVVAAVLLAVIGGGAATAAWLATGTGPAAAAAVTAQPITVVGGEHVATLYPRPAGGYPAVTPAVGTVHLTLTNPNPYPVSLTTASFGAVTTTAASGSVCPPGNVTVVTAGPVTLPAPLTLAPGATATRVPLSGVLQMLPSAPDGCQGAVSTVAVTLTGSST
jgi:hypothetical protein